MSIPSPVKNAVDIASKKQRLCWDTDDPGKEITSTGDIGNLDKSGSDQGDGEIVRETLDIDPGSTDSPSSEQD